MTDDERQALAHLFIAVEKSKGPISRGITNEIKCGTRPRKRDTIMSNFDPSTMTPEDAHAIVIRIAALLGIPAEQADHDSVASALGQLFAVQTGDNPNEGAPEVVGARAKLTPSELAICKEMKCDPRDFIKLKALRDGKR